MRTAVAAVLLGLGCALVGSAGETAPDSLPTIGGGWVRRLKNSDGVFQTDRHGATVFFGNGSGVSAYKLADGSLMWRNEDLNCRLPGLLFKDGCEIGIGNGVGSLTNYAITAFSESSGEELWRQNDLCALAYGADGVWARRAIQPGDLLPTDRGIVLLDPKTGNLLRSFRYSQVSDLAGLIPGDGATHDRLFFYADHYARALSVEGQLWAWRCGGPDHAVNVYVTDAGMLAVDNYLATNQTADLRSTKVSLLRPEDGAVIWQMSPEDYHGGALNVPQTLVLGSNFVLSEETVVMIRPGFGTLRGSLRLYEFSSGRFIGNLNTPCWEEEVLSAALLDQSHAVLLLRNYENSGKHDDEDLPEQELSPKAFSVRVVDSKQQTESNTTFPAGFSVVSMYFDKDFITGCAIGDFQGAENDKPPGFLTFRFDLQADGTFTKDPPVVLEGVGNS